jgi:hypothetical protein
MRVKYPVLVGLIGAWLTLSTAAPAYDFIASTKIVSIQMGSSTRWSMLQLRCCRTALATTVKPAAAPNLRVPYDVVRTIRYGPRV